MNNLRLRRSVRTLILIAMLGFWGLAISFYAQAQSPTSDRDQIIGLLSSLSDHSKAPAEVLDPVLSSTDRERNLKHFSASLYELSVVPNGGAPEIAGDSAAIPVRVHYKDENGNSLDVSATAQFIRRDGVWYFASYDFMKWPVFLIVILVVGILVGISYAVTVLILWNRLTKNGMQGANAIKIFIPLFWPSLFRQNR